MQRSSKISMYVMLIGLGLLAVILTACTNQGIDNSNFVEDASEPEVTLAPTVVADQTLLDLYDNGDFLRISDIQGEGHNSQYTREYVENVAGVITVKRADGFYMQSIEDDGNEKTSEGIFVFLNKPPKAEVGDLVFVQGKVAEFYPGGADTGNLSITQIEDAYYAIASSNNALPDPIVLGEGGRKIPTDVIDDDNKSEFDMKDGLDFYESLEGMLVQINNPVVVGGTTAYKEISILADDGKGVTGRNSRGGITINENDFNPERIILDDSLASLPEMTVGEHFEAPVIGVVDYTFGNFKIQVLKRARGDKSGISPETVEDKSGSLLTVVSYNVENLDAKDSDSRFETIADQIVNNLASPDIIAMQEIQDNNGAAITDDASANETYQKIIDAVVAIGGPAYSWTDVRPEPNKDGGEPGGNIRVGYLYRTDTGITLADQPYGTAKDAVQIITPNGEAALSLNPGRIDPTNYAFYDSRKPVVAQFEYKGKSLFIINNHWNSKGGDNPLFGSIQPPRLESETQRNQQAAVVASFIEELLAVDPNALVLLTGDLNDFYFSSPIEKIKDAGLVDLFLGLEINERYTYIYDGNSQNLDNMLVSSSLEEYLVEFDVVHINSELPYRSRFSDHDPVLARFDIGN